MSIVGASVETSLLQAAQAQHVASKKRNAERSEANSRALRYRDLVDLKVAGVETIEAIRALPDNTSEQQHEEERSHAQPRPEAEDEPHVHIDIQA